MTNMILREKNQIQEKWICIYFCCPKRSLNSNCPTSLKRISRFHHQNSYFKKWILNNTALSEKKQTAAANMATTPFLRNKYWVLRHGKSIPNEKGLIVSSLVFLFTQTLLYFILYLLLTFIYKLLYKYICDVMINQVFGF